MRLSGERSLEILEGLVHSPARRDSHRLRVATIYDASGDVLDRGMVVEMLQPNSYTGEDIVDCGFDTTCQAVV